MDINDSRANYGDISKVRQALIWQTILGLWRSRPM